MTSSLISTSTASHLKSGPLVSDPNNEGKVEIFIDKHIGSGKFHVYHAFLPLTQTEYALKVFPKDRASEASYLREKDAITSFREHKNIIKYISNINLKGLDTSNANYILLEYAPYGNFYELVLNKGLIEEKIIRTYFHQLIDGLEYLHSQGIAHVDLKLDNLLLGDDFLLKISDFDQSQKFEDKKVKCRGTACYRAPEIFEGNCDNLIAADIYSIGIILYTMKAREFPFIEQNNGAKTHLLHFDLFTENNEEFWKVKVADKINPNYFSDSFKVLLNGMMEQDPSKRFSVEDIKNSEWYNEPIFTQEELKIKMEKLWERILFKKSLKRGRSPSS